MPRENTASAVARRDGGKWSLIRDWAAGRQPASPTPTPVRARASWTKLWARPHTAVMADQTAMQAVISSTRLRRSASRARGTPSTV